MSPKPKKKLVFLVTILMVFLLRGLPVQAQPAHQPLADSWRKVAVLSDSVLARIGTLFLSLWPEGAMKEGTSIDPDGSPHPSGTSSDPQEGSGDEGVLIDPNGKP